MFDNSGLKARFLRMNFSRIVRIVFFGFLLASFIPSFAAESGKGPTEPELHSLGPLGGAVGSEVEVEIKGKYLAGTYAAWFGSEMLQATVKSVVAVEPPSKDVPVNDDGPKKQTKDDREYKVKLQISVGSDVTPGAHFIRLVSPTGVSNKLYFQVHEHPVLTEIDKVHNKPELSQAIQNPVVVNGKIGRQGELDYYSIEVAKNEELAFEVITTHQTLAGFRPQLRLYESFDSWLGAQKYKRLAFHTEIEGEIPNSPGLASPPYGSTPINSGLTYRFPKKGRYFIEVGSERYVGKSEYTYQLRVVPTGSEYARLLKGLQGSMWGRNFTRSIGVDRLSVLWSRTVTVNRPSYIVSEGEPPTRLSNAGTLYNGKKDNNAGATEQVKRFSEKEPNEKIIDAVDVTLPALVSGTIDRPDDVDVYRFEVTSPIRLAFELETPQVTLPYFTPRLEIRDALGRSMLTNLHKVKPRSAADNATDRWELKDIEPKVIEIFDQPGEYTVEIRDVTSRSGGQDCSYKLLIRPQVPHVGEITVETLKRGPEDKRIDPLRLNLRPGEVKTLTITTKVEEIDAEIADGGGQRSFKNGTGEMGLLVVGLPEGVRALPGTGITDIQGRPRNETIKKYNFLPDVLKSILVIQAAPDAPLTTLPSEISVMLQPLIGTKAGKPLLAAKLPVMVISGTDSGN